MAQTDKPLPPASRLTSKQPGRQSTACCPFSVCYLKMLDRSPSQVIWCSNNVPLEFMQPLTTFSECCSWAVNVAASSPRTAASMMTPSYRSSVCGSTVGVGPPPVGTGASMLLCLALVLRSPWVGSARFMAVNAAHSCTVPGLANGGWQQARGCSATSHGWQLALIRSAWSCHNPFQ
jgi:hypothetical protein